MNGGEQKSGKTETIILGAGCFWCVEAVFQRLEGVLQVECGYAGGTKVAPTYEDVCSGKTGHAEVARIFFDPGKITLETILETFWKAHDPTTLNRQGADAGTQYRSVIFYGDEMQKMIAQQSRSRAQKEWDRPIVTSLEPIREFFKAENYHQDYFRNNPDAPYCQIVIKPKLAKLGLKVTEEADQG